MSYQSMAASGAAEPLCRYGQSKLWFRGPKRALDDPFVACLGGEETFGRFVETPFVAGLEKRLKRQCLNLGSLFCGVEALCQDKGLVQLANSADICVLQLPGMAGQTNRFYRVHPRRNDRFTGPTQDLVDLFPEVDFTDIHFVRHLLCRLHKTSATRFSMVADELRQSWTNKLESFLCSVTPPVVLLCLNMESDTVFDPAPLEPAMLEALKGHCARSVRMGVHTSGTSDNLEDLLFGTLQQPMAEHVIGPATHRKIADKLSRVILDIE